MLVSLTIDASLSCNSFNLVFWLFNTSIADSISFPAKTYSLPSGFSSGGGCSSCGGGCSSCGGGCSSCGGGCSSCGGGGSW